MKSVCVYIGAACCGLIVVDGIQESNHKEWICGTLTMLCWIGYIMFVHRSFFKTMDRLKSKAMLFITNDSISFAKWINQHGYKEYDESDRWIESDGKGVFTTSQLYNKYVNDSKVTA